MSDKTNERGEPDEIWMQIHGDANPADYPDGPLPDLRGDDVTWCWEPIFEHDVKYVRADIVAALEAENARLRALIAPGLRVYKGDYIVQVVAGKLGSFAERHSGDGDIERATRVAVDAAMRGDGGEWCCE